MLYDYLLPDKGVLRYAIEKDKLTDEQYISIHSATDLPVNATIEIPSEIYNTDLGKTLTVKTIEYCAFEDMVIDSVILPKTIKSIFSCAFLNSKIKSINLPEGLTFLGTSAFRDCYNLKEISIPSTLSVIKEHTFTGCKDLTKVNFKEGLKHIHHSAFKCTNISSLNFPDSLTVIGESAFESCAVKNIKFGKGLVTIYSEAFYDCGQLETVKIQEGISEICEGAFSECKNLTSFILPDSLQKLNSEVLDNCGNLTHVHLGKNTKIVENNDFCFSCNSLERITVNPENKQYYVKDDVLYDAKDKMLVKACPCSPISHILVPPDIEDVYDYAFQGLNQISTIRFQCDDLPNIVLSSLAYITPKNKFKVFCKPDSGIEKYCRTHDIRCNSISKLTSFLLENNLENNEKTTEAK